MIKRFHTTEDWINADYHLPDFLRDDNMKHNLVFFLECSYRNDKDFKNIFNHAEPIVNLQTIHHYLFSIFLPFMAQYGLILKPVSTKTKINFNDLKYSLIFIQKSRDEHCDKYTDQIWPKIYDKKIDKYRKNLAHYPVGFDDFDNLKDIFYWMHSYYMDKYKDDENYTKLNPINGHIFIADYFLFICFKYGYKLQYTTTRLSFKSLWDDVNISRNERQERMSQSLLKMLNHNKNDGLN